IIDQLTLTPLDLDSSSAVQHDQIFGEVASWTKLAFYVKLNSRPDANDGVFRQRLNDRQNINVETIPGVRYVDGLEVRAKWNLVAIGGNDFFQIYDNELRYEEWYAIDDLVVRSDVPDYLENTDALAPPSAPGMIDVE